MRRPRVRALRRPLLALLLVVAVGAALVWLGPDGLR
jgi:hypothetical protein